MKSNRMLAVATMVATVLAAAPVGAQDPAAGQKLVEARCQICHYAVPGKDYIGPSLFGVFRRHIGGEPGYHYSKAQLAANVVFDEAMLDRWITSPRGMVPGTRMTYEGVKTPEHRADIVAYLKTLQ
jgi:cytochrome c